MLNVRLVVYITWFDASSAASVAKAVAQRRSAIAWRQNCSRTDFFHVGFAARFSGHFSGGEATVILVSFSAFAPFEAKCERALLLPQTSRVVPLACSGRIIRSGWGNYLITPNDCVFYIM